LSEDLELDRRKSGNIAAGGDSFSESFFDICIVGNDETKVGTLLRAAG
jgi:hypothetical protein